MSKDFKLSETGTSRRLRRHSVTNSRHRNRSTSSGAHRSGRGFTLVQILVVLSIISILAALTFGTMARARGTAYRAQCDVRLKAIVLAWDAFRQENRKAPASLKELRDKSYIQADMMRCPADPRAEGAELEEDYSLIRAPRDDSAAPFVVCPFHEDGVSRGAQGYVGRYTTQFKTAPAVLVEANGTTVQRPHDPAPIVATQGMELRGGDRIITGGSGRATIRFADHPTTPSTATLAANSDLTVLQSFIQGNTAAPWYTLVRQKAGRVMYQVHTGNGFDVATPTATAGARGTAFVITIDANGNSTLVVTEGEVTVSTTGQLLYDATRPVTSLLGLIPLL